MKKTTISHIKFELLSSLLGLSRWETVGILETLWQFCQFHAYDGDLSKFGPAMISAWFGWKGKPQELIDALVESKWVDREGDRLAVHDWHDHAPNWVKGALKTSLSKPSANERTLSNPLSNPLSGPLSDPLSNPLLGKGKVRKDKVRCSTPDSVPVDAFAEWWEIYPRKVDKKTAEKAYRKTVEEIAQTEPVQIDQAARLLHDWTQARLPTLLTVEERYRPYPTTWLNKGRYRDDLAGTSTDTAIAGDVRSVPETKLGDYVHKPKAGRPVT